MTPEDRKGPEETRTNKEPKQPYNSTSGTNKETFLEKYTPFLIGITNTPKESSRAMLQLIISTALFDPEYRNSKGKISANLSIIWIAPSGSNKTPLIENGILKLQDFFNEFRLYGEFTGKGFRHSASKSESKLYKALIVGDEFSTSIKGVRNSASSDIFEVLF